MKTIILSVFIIILSVSNSFAEKVLIIFVDGKVIFTAPAMKSKKDSETLDQFYNRVFGKVLSNYPSDTKYIITERSELPKADNLGALYLDSGELKVDPEKDKAINDARSYKDLIRDKKEDLAKQAAIEELKKTGDIPVDYAD